MTQRLQRVSSLFPSSSLMKTREALTSAAGAMHLPWAPRCWIIKGFVLWSVTSITLSIALLWKIPNTASLQTSPTLYTWSYISDPAWLKQDFKTAHVACLLYFSFWFCPFLGRNGFHLCVVKFYLARNVKAIHLKRIETISFVEKGEKIYSILFHKII